MPKGLSYESKEQCIADARKKGVSPDPCRNVPSEKKAPEKEGRRNVVDVMKSTLQANPRLKDQILKQLKDKAETIRGSY